MDKLGRRAFIQRAAADLGTWASWRGAPDLSGVGTVRHLALRNTFLSQNGNLAGWEYAFGKMVDDYSGGVFNPYWGRYGAMVFHGGGHAATFDNSVVVLDLNDLTFKRLSHPTPSRHGTYWATTAGEDPAFDRLHGEYGDGQPGAVHTYDTLALLPPEDGGAPCGSLIRVASFAAHVNLSANAGWAHRFDFGSTEMHNGRWSRWSVNGPTTYLSPGACSAYDALRKRIWWVSALSSLPPLIRYLDVVTRQQRDIAFSRIDDVAPAAHPDSATLRYDRQRDMLVLTCTVAGEMALAYLRCDQPERGWSRAALSLRVPVVPDSAVGFDWDPGAQRYVLLTPADLAAVYELALPAGGLAGAVWPVLRRPVVGAAFAGAKVVGKRWSYAPALGAYVWMAHSRSAVAVYRPPAAQE